MWKNLLIIIGLASDKARLNKGEELWRKFNALLPPAVAVIKDDEPRVQEFAKMVSRLRPSYQNCLREYLQYEVDHAFDAEMVTALEEQAERKHWQIMDHHLEAISEPKD